MRLTVNLGVPKEYIITKAMESATLTYLPALHLL